MDWRISASCARMCADSAANRLRTISSVELCFSVDCSVAGEDRRETREGENCGV
jgi:hypothetical protein